ncbi:YbaB/EbfC family nucleoid-associated protein [Amycolatopsis sp. GM8]|uniref:YbaB/EbfC family nucleoid-associated protein n=1 Tax=Amycolatopsis sp. GM8 TaxID=2896530 RepID=UPI001F47AF54|nr:YbaB/EbfC family nucleoid-associated protein [Amycolatopsis sp. GM8]
MNSPGDAGIADIKHKAEVAKAQLQQLSATLSSHDGAATVTVNASGALQKVTFGAKARELPLEQLAATVVTTAQRAQAQAARQITAIMAPVVGNDSDAMHFLEEQLPAPDVPDEQPPPAAQDRRLVLNEERAAPPVQPPAPPRPPAPPAPPRPQRARPPALDDDGDDGSGSIMQRGW